MSSVDRPTAPRAGEALDAEALGAYLEATLGGASEPPVVRQFPSGFSNLTYAVRWGEHDLVLRRPPVGSKVASAHDMAREYRILSALAPVYPKAPRPIALCDDPAVLGATFYLMERRRGVILRGAMTGTGTPAPESMQAAARGWLDTLVDLHALDPEALGLADLDRGDGYVERQIGGWTRRWEGSRLDGQDEPRVDEVAAWLGANLPPEAAHRLVHNDFKYDNVVYDPEDPGRVTAVLDWEMATIGDPWMDLGTSLGYWVDPDDDPALLALALSPTALPGNPSRLEIARSYEEARGEECPALVFHFVYGLFKIAVIVQQIFFRYRRGLTRDPRFAKLDLAVAALGRTAGHAIDRGRIDRLH